MKLLLTGFQPGFGIKRTPSGEIVKLWQDGSLFIPGVDITTLVLPQLFDQAAELVINEINSFQPDVVLMLGATQGPDPVKFERFAINVMHTTGGDNSRIPIEDKPVLVGGPSAYESNFPFDGVINKLAEKHLYATKSFHAGTHVCNAVLYSVLHHVKTKQLKTVVGFSHMRFPDDFGVIESHYGVGVSFSSLVDIYTEVIKILAGVE